MEWWQSNRIYLQIEESIIPVEPEKGYTLMLDDNQSVFETEAGTKVRSIRRLSVPQIVVALDCDKGMLRMFHTYKGMDSLRVDFYNPNYIGTGNDNLESSYMFITGYKEKMKADTQEGGIWRVDFTLEELEPIT